MHTIIKIFSSFAHFFSRLPSGKLSTTKQETTSEPHCRKEEEDGGDANEQKDNGQIQIVTILAALINDKLQHTDNAGQIGHTDPDQWPELSEKWKQFNEIRVEQGKEEEIEQR